MAAVASIPVAAPDGQLIGVICVHHGQPRHWSPAQQRTLTRLGQASPPTRPPTKRSRSSAAARLAGCGRVT
uniref:GAF domain-containing protein n=1 Tax=Streptomyces kunmingensis TaxID=68225 RepID=UPI0039837E10